MSAEHRRNRVKIEHILHVEHLFSDNDLHHSPLSQSADQEVEHLNITRLPPDPLLDFMTKVVGAENLVESGFSQLTKLHEALLEDGQYLVKQRNNASFLRFVRDRDLEKTLALVGSILADIKVIHAGVKLVEKRR